MTEKIRKISDTKYEITPDATMTNPEKQIVDILALENTIIYLENEFKQLGENIVEKKGLLKKLKNIKQ